MALSPATYPVPFPPDWEPREYANLVFIVQGDEVLLIRKKRGLGAGKINGPGGKLEPGETALEAAVREVREEIGVTPLEVEERGVLHFQFTDGYALHCVVFVARAYAGTPVETAEAVPQWHPRGALPYGEMWADDRLWLGRALAGERFRGWFVFAGEEMLAHALEWA
jgi:8-oxo-dGTP diphosphatase